MHVPVLIKKNLCNRWNPLQYYLYSKTKGMLVHESTTINSFNKCDVRAAFAKEMNESYEYVMVRAEMLMMTIASRVRARLHIHHTPIDRRRHPRSQSISVHNSQATR